MDTCSEWPVGLKRTRQRECVLSVLKASQGPLSAADICAQIEKNGEAVWLSTVYRILEMFVEKEIAVKANVRGSEMAVYELNRFCHKHYAVCVSCHKIIAMDNCPLEEFTPQLQEQDFHVLGHTLEIFGYCRDCAPK